MLMEVEEDLRGLMEVEEDLHGLMEVEEDLRGLSIDEIPESEKLMMDILSRLPVKTLMRFKLVAKSFNSLISDNRFVKLQLRRSSAPNANPAVLFWESNDPHDDGSVNPDADISTLHVKSLLKTPLTELETITSNWKHPYGYMPIGTCNGLVCLIGSHEEFFWLSFWNPATRSSTSEKLFRLPLTMPEDVETFFDLYCGFGYDHVTETFKVLLLDRYQYVIVFNMGGTNWRRVAPFPTDLTTLENKLIGVHFNGTLNWLAILKIYEDRYRESTEWDNGSSMILSFDLNKEEFVRFLLPAMPHGFGEPHLGVLDECLCVSLFDVDNFMIWQMKEFGVDSSWTKLLKINRVDEIAGRDFNKNPPFGFPIHMFDNGDVLVVLLEDFQFQLILINARDNRITPLQFPNEIILPTAMICCESLISPC